MQKLTIKLLHERKSTNRLRKCNGKSGMVYAFRWNDEHKAYCFETEKQEEADDLFEGQGRMFGCYFAPVLKFEAAPEAAKPEETSPISDALVAALIERGLDIPKERDAEAIGLALVVAYDLGRGPAVAITASGAVQETETANSGPTVSVDVAQAETPQPARRPRKADSKQP